MKICIDAGHNNSGFDTGASANGLREQDITFAISNRLKEVLQSHGIEIVMTRNQKSENLGNSVNSSIRKRVSISNENACDYFISIHTNAGGGTGTETLIYKKGGKAQLLANAVQSVLTDALPLRNRGIKEANLGVLRDTDCPAVLIELAFIDHPSDAKLLAENQADFAVAIAKGVLTYLGIAPLPTLETIKAFLAEKWNLSNPEGVFSILDAHPYREELYQKIYKSY